MRINTRKLFSLLLIFSMLLNVLYIPIAAGSDTTIPVEAIKIDGESAISGNIGNDSNGQEGQYAWVDHGSANSRITYQLTVETEGYYFFALKYTAGTVGTAKARTLTIDVNDQLRISTLNLPDTGTWNTWNTVTKKLYLKAGMNTVTFRSEAVENGMCLDYFHMWKEVYKIDGESAISGNIGNDPNGQEGEYAWIDHGSSNSSITYELTVETAGFYNFAFQYTAGTVGTARERALAIDLNGQSKASTITLPDTGTWNTWNTVSITLPLQAGTNTITLRAEAVGNGMCLDYFHVWKLADEVTISSIQFMNSSINVEIGKTAHTTVGAIYSNNAIVVLSDGVEFHSSDNGIVTIDSKGIVTGVAEGTANITATYNGLTADAVVTVDTSGFIVNFADEFRPATQVASGMLYGLAEEGRPVDELIAPIKPKNFTQMAPNGGQLPNGETKPIGDALVVAPIAKRHGATVTIRLPDIFPSFPYTQTWVSMNDWLSKVDTMVTARLNSGADNIYAYEIWNEPNWTWTTSTMGIPFNEGWKLTYERIKLLDAETKIMGPSLSLYDENYLRNFLTYCKANNCLPDIISWHELGDPEPEGNFRDKPGTPYIQNHIKAYRALERELGIQPLPISINEYGVQIEEAVPGNMVQYFAQFERGGVDTANSAFWFRPGRLSNLITENGERNGGWWLYKWYGDMSGMMAMTSPASKTLTLGLDGIASIDSNTEQGRVLFGGGTGDTVIQVKGLEQHSFFGSKVRVKVQATPWYGVDTAVQEPFDYYEGIYEVREGKIAVPLNGLKPAWGYNMVITKAMDETVGEPDLIPVRYEAEAAVLNRARAVHGSYASEGLFVGNIDFVDSYVQFNNVHVNSAGTYQLEIGYANGTTTTSTHNLTINSKAEGSVSYAPTGGWIGAVPNFGYRKIIQIPIQLEAGENTIRFTKGNGFTELDYIRVIKPDQPVTELSVSTTGSLSQIQVGHSLQMIASVLPHDATDPRVTWTVTNLDGTATDKASMDSSGLLTAILPGDVKVTAVSRSNGSLTDSKIITIIEANNGNGNGNGNDNGNGNGNDNGNGNGNDNGNGNGNDNGNGNGNDNGNGNGNDNGNGNGNDNGNGNGNDNGNGNGNDNGNGNGNDNGNGNGNGGSNSNNTSPDRPVSGTPGKVVISKPLVNEAKRTATATVDMHALTNAFADSKVAVVEIAKAAGVDSYVASLPAAALAANGPTRVIQVVTEIGSVAVRSNMLAASQVAGANMVELLIGKAEITKLDDSIKAAIGNKPVLELQLGIDGHVIPWSNADAPVTVLIPYTPTKTELADPELLTVWYLDEFGKAHSIPTGKFDPVTGMISFTTTHFSKYAVTYVTKTFDDLVGFTWAKKAIEVMASKGIINGTSERTYKPGDEIKRADFLMLLVKALGLSAITEDNFTDVSPDAYYADAVAVAKKLGITTGDEGNKFNPDAKISRQDMMTLVHRAMKVANKEMTAGSNVDLDKFADKDKVAPYATQSVASLIKNGLVSGDGTKINPLGNATRAEVAVLIHRLYQR